MKRKLGFMMLMCMFLFVVNAKEASAKEQQKYGDFQYTYNDAGEITLEEYTGSAKEVIVPAQINGKPVCYMGEVFYHNETVEKVTLPEGIKVVSGFDGCSNLVEVNIPKSTVIIDNFAFYRCENLSQITLPNGLEEIGDYAFAECEMLTKIKLPNTVKVLEQRAFYMCESLSQITLSNKLTVIEEGTFYECANLKSIKIPNKVKRINEDAFGNCSSLKKVTLPNSLVTIESYAFVCPITQITIPKNVTYIGDYAFDCTKLKKVKIKTKKLRYYNDDSFSNTLKPMVIEVPANCYEKYKSIRPYNGKLKKVM